MDPPRPMRSLLAFQIIMVVLGLSLGVVLIWQGAIVVGLIIAALAVTRLGMIIVWRRRRAVLIRRYQRRFEYRQ